MLGRLFIRYVNRFLGRIFGGFNWLFDRTTELYGQAVGWCLRLSAIALLVYVGLIGLTGFGFTHIPKGFVPEQDKGYLVVNVQLPDSASLERTIEATKAVEKIALETPGVGHTVGIAGMSFVLNANSSNYGSMFISLKPFEERRESRAEWGGHRRASPRTISTRDTRRARAGLPGASGAWTGQRRRVQADGRNDRRCQL